MKLVDGEKPRFVAPAEHQQNQQNLGKLRRFAQATIADASTVTFKRDGVQRSRVGKYEEVSREELKERILQKQKQEKEQADKKKRVEEFIAKKKIVEEKKMRKQKEARKQISRMVSKSQAKQERMLNKKGPKRG